MTYLAPIRGRPPGPLGRWLLRRLGAAVTIEVSPRELRVVGPGGEVVAARDGRGGPPLFGGSAHDVPAPYERLVATLRGALAAVLPRRRVHVKPAVTFRGVASLDEALGGFQAVVLALAALDAGAHRVDFDPPLPAPRDGLARPGRAT